MINNNTYKGTTDLDKFLIKKVIEQSELANRVAYTVYSDSARWDAQAFDKAGNLLLCIELKVRAFSSNKYKTDIVDQPKIDFLKKVAKEKETTCLLAQVFQDGKIYIYAISKQGIIAPWLPENSETMSANETTLIHPEPGRKIPKKMIHLPKDKACVVSI